MELRHFRYAVAVAEAGSFTRAAATLHIAQQALSQQIADLERELQVRLFDRTRRGVSPTVAGIAFLEAARQTLADSDRAISVARSGPSRQVGHLAIGLAAAHQLFERFLIEALARVRESYPDVEIDVQRIEPTSGLFRLRRDTLDFAFTHAPPEEDADIVSELVVEVGQSGVLLPAGHPLSAKTPLWLRDLSDLPLLTAPPGSRWSLPHGSPFQQRSLVPRLSPILLSGSVQLEAAAVARGWGWALAIAPDRPELLGPGVVFRPLADAPIPLGFWLVYRAGPQPLLRRGFVKACRELSLALRNRTNGGAMDGGPSNHEPRASSA
ncbi:MAG TPA: LysR family transcriptional regulator [Gemmatimonadales bacterium]|nr:LysR family transcriptional regulator [Gemmatimonadales bacterium]